MATKDYWKDDDSGLLWINDSKPPDQLIKRIPPGYYRFGQTMAGSYFEVQGLSSDKLLAIKDPIHKQVLDEVMQFFQEETRKKYAQYEILYRRGILLYGKPGTGKTCVIKQVIEKAIKEDFIVMSCVNPHLTSLGISKIRAIEGSDRKVLVILEELDDILINYESHVLSLLDGLSSFDNVLYLATTNYLDEIPARIKNRPSRFASVIEVKAPIEEARRQFLKDKMKIDSPSELDKFTNATEGMVLDQVKDVVVSVCCFGLPLDAAVSRIREAESLCDDDEDDS